jgi:hypothetical protein
MGVKQTEMAKLIESTVKTHGPVEWKVIVAMAKSKHGEWKGMWLRNALQMALNMGEIERFPSVHVEEYQKVQP